MNKVWRYPIEPGLQQIKMPPESKVIHAGMACGEAFIWVLVKGTEYISESAYENQLILVVAIGELFSEDYKYIGTYEPSPGIFFHVFSYEVTR